jgi:hypothetical protein
MAVSGWRLMSAEYGRQDPSGCTKLHYPTRRGHRRCLTVPSLGVDVTLLPEGRISGACGVRTATVSSETTVTSYAAVSWPQQGVTPTVTP